MTRKSKVTVGYYLKNKPKDYSTFNSFDEARAFMKKLSNNKNCESYGIERARYA